MDDANIDEILGITRCVRCGHRLDGDIECPFCSVFAAERRKSELPKLIYITACFFTSPLSLYSLMKTERLNGYEKIFAFSGCFCWPGLYLLLT